MACRGYKHTCYIPTLRIGMLSAWNLDARPLNPKRSISGFSYKDVYVTGSGSGVPLGCHRELEQKVLGFDAKAVT